MTVKERVVSEVPKKQAEKETEQFQIRGKLRAFRNTGLDVYWVTGRQLTETRGG